MFTRIGVAIAIMATALGPASAQDWPARPVKVLAPFSAGGTADILGRLVAQKLSDSLGQNFVVENRTGGAGLIAAEATAKAPDGYTLASPASAASSYPRGHPRARRSIRSDFTHRDPAGRRRCWW
jgi:tripartite-type tricarboxylate transporter receptor subunit TctC